MGLAFGLQSPAAMRRTILCLALLTTLSGVAAAGDKGLPPGSVRVKIDEKIARGAMREALRKFHDASDMKLLEAKLPALAAGGDSKRIGREVEHSFRKIRKPAKAVRSLLVWLDDRHDLEAVKDLRFARFVTELGKLDSALGAGVEQEIAKRAKKTLAAMKGADFEADLAQFTPTSNATFQAYYDKQLEALGKAIAPKTLSARAFHDVRKVVRGLYFSMHFADDAKSQGPAVEAAQSLLKKIGSDMAEVHEQQERAGLEGKLDYDKLEFEFPAGIRADIARFLAAN